MKGGWEGPLHTFALCQPSRLLHPAFSASPYQKGPARFLTTMISPSPWGDLCAAPAAATCIAQLLQAPASLLATLGADPALAATMVVAAVPRAVAQNRYPQANICLKQHSSSPRMSLPSCPKANWDTSALQRPQPQPSSHQRRTWPWKLDFFLMLSRTWIKPGSLFLEELHKCPLTALQFPHIQLTKLAQLCWPLASHRSPQGCPNHQQS